MRLWLAVLVTACTGVDSDIGGGELVATGEQARVVAVASSEVYFASDEGVFRVTAAGRQLVSNDTRVYHLTADAQAVYWLGSDAVYALHVGESVPRALGDRVGTSLRNVVNDDRAVYYANEYGDVLRFAKDGSGRTTAGTTDTSAASLAVSPDGIWVTTLTGAKLLGAATELHFGERLPDALAATGDELFVAYAGTGDSDGRVVRVPDTILADELVLPTTLVATDDALYITTGNHDAAVRRISRAGGGSRAIAGGHRPSSLAVDADYVYWTDPHPGEVRRTPR